jgi:hypothetical protein
MFARDFLFLFEIGKFLGFVIENGKFLDLLCKNEEEKYNLEFG